MSLCIVVVRVPECALLVAAVLGGFVFGLLVGLAHEHQKRLLRDGEI